MNDWQNTINSAIANYDSNENRSCYTTNHDAVLFVDMIDYN